MPTVDAKHPQYDKFKNKWQRCRDVLDADAVKEAGTAYLPKLSGQDTGVNRDEYSGYKMRAYFYEAMQRTIQGVSGLVFRKDLTAQLPNATAAQDLFDNVDLRGTPMERFAQSVYDEVMAMGRCGVYVTLPRGASPLARAYMTYYRAEDIINWQVALADESYHLTRVVLHELVDELDPDDPYKAELVDQWRDVYLDEHGLLAVTVWRENKAGGAQEKFRIHDHVEPTFRGQRLNAIKFKFINASSTMPEVEKPPLVGLADANLHHYRLMADYGHGLHFTGLPWYVIIGGNNEDEVKIGSSIAAQLPEGADAKIVEFTGQGLQALENAVDKLVGYMASLGARLLEAEKKAAETEETHRCVFRSKVTTHFGPKLPLISEQSYHLFRSESFHFLCRCRNGW